MLENISYPLQWRPYDWSQVPWSLVATVLRLSSLNAELHVHSLRERCCFLHLSVSFIRFLHWCWTQSCQKNDLFSSSLQSDPRRCKMSALISKAVAGPESSTGHFLGQLLGAKKTTAVHSDINWYKQLTFQLTPWENFEPSTFHTGVAFPQFQVVTSWQWGRPYGPRRARISSGFRGS